MKYYLMTPALGIVDTAFQLSYKNDPKPAIFADIEMAKTTALKVLERNDLRIMWIMNDDDNKQVETVIRQQ